MTKQTIQTQIAVLGGGPGGYPAAIVAAQAGKKVVLIEEKQLGGTCLNRGCIPSKTLIAGGELFAKIQQAEQFGINLTNASVDFAKMAKNKDDVVTRMRKGLESLIAANQITVVKGRGTLVSSKQISVQGENGETLIDAEKIILATGSEPRSIPAFPFDQQFILDSTALLERKDLPKKLVIIGGGVIGCEFASLYKHLGVDVTVLEMLPRLLPMEAEEVSKALQKAFEKRGIKIATGVKVESIAKTNGGIQVKTAAGPSFDGDIALVSVGRSLNTRTIGLEKAGVTVAPDGQIPVNDQMETNVPGIYAVGDIASKWWLAHVATHQGVIAAKNASGTKAHMHYDAIPAVTFTHPEIATVGLSLEVAKQKGFDAVVGSFPFQALGKSQAILEPEGFAQVVTDRKTGQILGAQVVGHEASTLIAEMAVAIANELTTECIAETIHAHPTLPEAWHEATLLAMGTPLHLPPKPLRKS